MSTKYEFPLFSAAWIMSWVMSLAFVLDPSLSVTHLVSAACACVFTCLLVFACSGEDETVCYLLYPLLAIILIAGIIRLVAYHDVVLLVLIIPQSIMLLRTGRWYSHEYNCHVGRVEIGDGE